MTEMKPDLHRLDSYAAEFSEGEREERKFCDEVALNERHSTWMDQIHSNLLRLSPVDTDFAIMEANLDYGVPNEVAMDTQNGTKLMLKTTFNDVAVEAVCVAASAYDTLLSTACLTGSALSRMEPVKLADTLNNALEVAKGKSLILKRWDKIAAVHSDASNGYRIMPIPELVRILQEEVSSRFGMMQFQGGHIEHKYVHGVWTLPEAKKRLIGAYEQALRSSGMPSQYSIGNLMPAVSFYSSDTANSATRVIPLFIAEDGMAVQMVDGVRVVHERKAAPEDAGQETLPDQLSMEPVVENGSVSAVVVPGGVPASVPASGVKDGVELFRDELKNLYALFENSIQKAAELSRIEIYHPENCVVSLCKKMKIAKKWAGKARDEIEAFACMAPVLSAHDVYLSMSRMAAEARMEGASAHTINTLTESVAKVLLITDWAEYDIGGVVAW